MRRIFVVGVLAAVAGLGFERQALAAPISPFATLSVGLQSIPLTLTADPSKSGRFFFSGALSGADFDVSVNGTLDPDPQVLFSLNAQNFGTLPINIALAAAVIFSPITTATLAQSSINGSLQPGTGAPSGVTITPLVGDMDGDGVPEMLVTSAGDPITNLGIDVGPTTAFSTAGANSFGFAAGPVLGPMGLIALQTNLNFALSGGGDVADVQGASQLAAQTVPEPMSLVLLGAGLTLTTWRWRKSTRK